MQTISKPTAMDIFLIFMTALIWASAFSAMKIVVPETGPYWLSTFRVGIGFLALLPFFLLSKGVQHLKGLSGREWGLVTIIAIANMVYPFIAISWGVKSVDSGVAALLMGTSPIFALVISHFATNDDKISVFKVIAVLLGIAGILTIVGPSALTQVGDSLLLGQLAIMSGAVSYVIAGTFMRQLSLPALPFTLLALGIATLMLVILSLLVEGTPRLLVSSAASWSILWLGLFPTGLAYLLRYHLVRRVGMSTFAIGINMTPVFGVLLGALLLGEVISMQIAISLFLVIAALFFARIGSVKPDSASSKQTKSQ